MSIEHQTPRPTPDELLIDAAIAGAQAEEREIDDATARRIAAQLHGGQGSALYSLASTGSLEDERLRGELLDMYNRPTTGPQVKRWIDMLLTYRLHREHQGAVEGWAELTADRPGTPVAIGRTGIELATQAASESAYPWTEWYFMVGARDELGVVSHAYNKSGQTLCGERGQMNGASTYIRAEHKSDGTTHYLDQRCPGCVAEARRRWSDDAEQPEPGDQDDAGEEREPLHEPIEIRVESLRDYAGSGARHSVELDATMPPEELDDAIQYMLSRSPSGDGAEEWFIEEYIGFHGLSLGDHPALETVHQVATGIQQHGEAFAEWVRYVGAPQEDAIKSFADHYRGHHDDMEAFVRWHLDESGAQGELDRALNPQPGDRLGAKEVGVVPPDLRQYVKFDVEAMALDWESEYFIVDAEGGGVHVFDTNY